jgi:hypothetical protein
LNGFGGGGGGGTGGRGGGGMNIGSSQLPVSSSISIENDMTGLNPFNSKLLPGKISVKTGSDIAKTSADLTSFLFPWDKIKFVDQNATQIDVSQSNIYIHYMYIYYYINNIYNLNVYCY